ncbi:MAG TPA: metallophosphoesterase, partial [Actinoallomurus sp.]
MRVAVLADVHGNLPALEAVLDDVETAGADVIVLNGDIAIGPMPAETLDLLATLGDRAIWVHGNGERELAEAYDGVLDGGLPDVVRRSAEYCATRLQERHRDLVAGLPMAVELDVTGLGPVRFCHATARSDTEFVLVDSPVDRYREAFHGVTEPTVVLGHTHMPGAAAGAAWPPAGTGPSPPPTAADPRRADQAVKAASASASECTV